MTVVRFLLFTFILLGCPPGAAFSQGSETTDLRYDATAALALSQGAIGGNVADFEFIDAQGQTVRLSDYTGQPLLVSLIFTSCHHICPAITRHLRVAVENARQALGAESFRVVTVGFDTANDSPEAMAQFARAQGIDDNRWDFLSGTESSVAALTASLGFTFFPTPRGFDHINQLSLLGRDGKVYAQVYGGAFELPALMEPLKELVFNRPASAGHPFAGLVDRVRLFCTVYDPTTGTYKFDYSLFVGVFIGFACLLAILVFLIRELRRGRKQNA